MSPSHFCLSAAKNLSSFQLLPASLITNLLQLFLGLPLFLFPWGFQSRATFGISPSSFLNVWPSSSSSSVICQTTGPKPLAKRFLHTVRSTASSSNSHYPLLSLRSSSNFLRLLPCLLVTSICPFIFPSITCFRRQFLRKMWPIQLAFRFIISCRKCVTDPSKFSFSYFYIYIFLSCYFPQVFVGNNIWPPYSIGTYCGLNCSGQSEVSQGCEHGCDVAGCTKVANLTNWLTAWDRTVTWADMRIYEDVTTYWMSFPIKTPKNFSGNQLAAWVRTCCSLNRFRCNTTPLD